MKIVAVMGTCRKNGAGARYLKKIADALAGQPGVVLEPLWLGDYGLGICRGCMVCYDRGEAACPLKDGYPEAMARLNAADAAIFYSPTYALSISGLMKTFFDRSSWVLHRPHFKGRHAIVFTAVAAYGHRSALKTLQAIVHMMGFSIDGALGIVNARYDSSPAYRARVDARLARAARRLVARAASGRPVRPSLYELVAFRFQRATFGADTPGCANDKRYWREAGWATPDARYYCKARISPIKALLARGIAHLIRATGLLP